MGDNWLLPTLGFVVTTGAVGVTAKLAQRSLGWQDLIVWTAIGYALLALVLIAFASASVRVTEDIHWASLAGILPAVSLAFFFIAINNGEVSRVVPVSSAYPLVAAGLSIAFLSERVSWVHVAAMAMIVGGVVVLSRA